MDTNPPRQALVAATADDDLIRILGNSLYPGARPESIRLVLAWCKATGRDPMKKPIHIVPMEVKDVVTGVKAYRDVLMPGIGTYRADAANSGAYGGIDEPEFGPDVTEQIDTTKITYPAWCKITVYRLVNNEKRAFTAKEYWIENYASGYQGKGVNAMWRKRPYGQLAKVAEAQALRKAFPDETGQTNTTDEMEGKTFAGETIDATVDEQPRRETKREQPQTIRDQSYPSDNQTKADDNNTDEVERISAFMVQTDADLCNAKNGSQAYRILMRAYEMAPTLDDLTAIEGHPFRASVRKWEGDATPLRAKADEAAKIAAARLAPKPDEEANTGRVMWDAPTDGEMAQDLAGQGANGTHTPGAALIDAKAVQEQVETVAKTLEADKSDPEPQTEWMPGDP
jgi:phage recombination protein Bet